MYPHTTSRSSIGDRRSARWAKTRSDFWQHYKFGSNRRKGQPEPVFTFDPIIAAEAGGFAPLFASLKCLARCADCHISRPMGSFTPLRGGQGEECGRAGGVGSPLAPLEEPKTAARLINGVEGARWAVPPQLLLPSAIPRLGTSG